MQLPNTQTSANLITIRLGKASYFKENEQSLYISFAYSLDAVSKIKGLPNRNYEAKTREWEVPPTDINKTLDMFASYQVKIQAPATTTAVEAPEQEARVKFPIVSQHDNVIEVDFNWKTTPYDHQRQALAYSLTHDKFLLGDEQGLGKTKESIDIAVSRKGQFKHVLVVCCVASSKTNWLKEVHTHSHESGYILGSYLDTKGKLKDGTMQDRLDDLNSDFDDYFLITNIETFREVPKKKDDALSKQELIQKKILERVDYLTRTGQIGMVIIDEVHKCKNPQSQQGKAIHHLKSHYKMALSGTPLMNDPIDLYNVLKWLGETEDSFTKFKERYCILGGFGGYDVVGHKNLSELQQRLNAIMLRRKKDEVLNLPPKIRSVEYVQMGPKQAQLYREVKAMITNNLDQIVLSPNPLATLIRLRQVTGCPSILSDKITESAKMDRLEEMVEELMSTGKKCIIFSNWDEVCQEVRKRLAKYGPAYITGSSKNNIDEEKEKFQTDPGCQIIIGTIGKLGTAHTLTAASTVFFVDEPWNMATKEQAEDRGHRIGTKGTVNIITLITQDSIDERIAEIVLEKADMADALVDGKMDKMEKRRLLERLLD